MLNQIHSFIRDERGEDLIEYGLLAAFVGAVALATLLHDPLQIRNSVVAAFKKAVLAIILATHDDVVQR